MVARRLASADIVLLQERLQNLERDVAEVRTRVNGLFFLVLGATLLQLLARLAG